MKKKERGEGRGEREKFSKVVGAKDLFTVPRKRKKKQEKEKRKKRKKRGKKGKGGGIKKGHVSR